LSYVGIITAFIYGVVINKDKIDVRKTVGAIIIIIANVLLLKM
jgi:multidrug transporter EmrE-like cation transporter